MADRTTEPRLLSGGNPQIPKGDGDAPVQAYLAAIPGWKRAIANANRVPFGLAAFAFTDSLRTANLVGDALEAGMVGINSFAISVADAPFGGVKWSGHGHEDGPEGLAACLVTKTVHEG